MNKQIIFGIGGVVIGAAGGFLAARYILDKKYSELLDQDRASFQRAIERASERFKRAAEEEKPVEEKKEDEPVYSVYKGNPPISDYRKAYAGEVSEEERTEPKEEPPEVYSVHGDSLKPPYFIEADQLGERDDYDVTTFDYYSDGVIADDMGHRVQANDLYEALGNLPYMEKFNSSDENTICIRNEKRKTDYEILINEETYAELLDEQPWLNE